MGKTSAKDDAGRAPKVIVVPAQAGGLALRLLDEDGQVVKPRDGGVRGPGGKVIRPNAASIRTMQRVLASIQARRDAETAEGGAAEQGPPTGT